MSSLSDTLAELDESFIKDGVSAHFLQIIKNEHEVVIRGNYEGLIYLAKNILQIAEKKTEGSHIHLDSSGILDRCDVDTVIAYHSEPCGAG